MRRCAKPEHVDAVVEFEQQYGWEETNRKFGIALQTFKRYQRDYRRRHNKQLKERQTEREESKNGLVLTVRSADIKTLDELIEYSDIDLNVWEVDRFIVNSWEVTISGEKTHSGDPETYTNYQVKAWLKKRSEQSIESVLEDFIADARNHAPTYKPIKYRKHESGNAAEISIPDLHFGQLSWGEETGEDYDIKIAQELFLDAFDYLLSRVKEYDVDQIIVPVGNDFFNVNSSALTTAAGTPQAEDERVPKTFTLGPHQPSCRLAER